MAHTSSEPRWHKESYEFSEKNISEIVEEERLI